LGRPFPLAASGRVDGGHQSSQRDASPQDHFGRCPDVETDGQQSDPRERSSLRRGGEKKMAGFTYWCLA